MGILPPAAFPRRRGPPGYLLTAIVRRLSMLAPLVSALLLWFPIRDNYFFHDDFVHLYDIATKSFGGFVTENWAGHSYLVRNTVFFTMFQAFGADPRPYFWSVLVTHALNVVLLHRVIRVFTGNAMLAVLGATLWGTCSVLEGTLGWYAVYGQVLLSTLLFAVLAALGDTVVRGRGLTLGHAACWGGLLAIGAQCFGIGLGVAAVFPLVVALALPQSQRSTRAVGILVLSAVGILGLYALLRIRAPIQYPQFDEMLSARATVAGIPAALVLTAHLLAFGTCTMLVGPPDLSYPNPTAALTAAGALVVLVAAWLGSDRTRRRRLLALSLLPAAAYGTVAVGRATLFEALHQSIPRAAAAPRYHYLSLGLLTLLLCSALGALGSQSRTADRLVTGGAVLALLARLFLVIIRPVPIDHHDSVRSETREVLRSITGKIEATPTGTVAVIDSRPFPPTTLVLALIPGRFPGWAGAFVIFFPENTVDGRPVRFGVSQDDWRNAQDRGGRIAALVVPANSP